MLLTSISFLKAQDTINYRDDEAYKKLVYKNVRVEMEKGNIKGFHQLWNEGVGVVANQKIDLKLKYANTSTPKRPSGLVKDLNKQVYLIWKFFRRTEKNIEGISLDATAFAMSENGVMMTNHHVFTKLFDKNATFYEMDSTLFLSDLQGNIFGIDKILTYNENADLALFTVKNTNSAKITPIVLGKPAEVGDPVFLMSHPVGYPYYFSSGMVSRNVKYGEFGGQTERMDITADYAVGSSGGPVVNEFGGLIGVVSSTHSIYARNQENLQMVVKETIPVKSIFSLIK